MLPPRLGEALLRLLPPWPRLLGVVRLLLGWWAPPLATSTWALSMRVTTVSVELWPSSLPLVVALSSPLTWSGRSSSASLSSGM